MTGLISNVANGAEIATASSVAPSIDAAERQYSFCTMTWKHENGMAFEEEKNAILAELTKRGDLFATINETDSSMSLIVEEAEALTKWEEEKYNYKIEFKLSPVVREAVRIGLGGVLSESAQAEIKSALATEFPYEKDGLIPDEIMAGLYGSSLFVEQDDASKVLAILAKLAGEEEAHGPMTVSGDQIKLEIRPEIFAQYPTAKVNVLTCAVSISDLKKKSDPATKALSTFKQETADMLANVHKISGANWEEQPVVKEWQTVFANFGKTIEAEQAFAAEKGLPTIQSTIVNAVKRASVQADNVKNGKKADMGKISSFVDMYNNVSLQNLVPMGAYAADKIAGNTIDLRFGKDGESFAPLMSAKEREAGIKASFDVKDGQVVYADEAGILTWLWNYRDADRTEVPYKSEEPVKIILMADAADSSDGKERGLKAIEQATALIEGALGGKVFGNWELSAQNPSAVLSFQK